MERDMEELFWILELVYVDENNPSLSEIRIAYENLLIKYDPELQDIRDDEFYKKKIEDINKAYDELISQKKRRKEAKEVKVVLIEDGTEKEDSNGEARISVKQPAQHTIWNKYKIIIISVAIGVILGSIVVLKFIRNTENVDTSYIKVEDKKDEIKLSVDTINNLSTNNIEKIFDGNFDIDEKERIVQYISNNYDIKSKLVEGFEGGYNTKRYINDILTINEKNKIELKKIEVEIKSPILDKLKDITLYVDDKKSISNNKVYLIPGEYKFQLVDDIGGVKSDTAFEKIGKPITIDLSCSKIPLEKLISLNITSTMEGASVYINGKKTDYKINSSRAIVPSVFIGETRVSLEFDLPWGKEMSKEYVVSDNILEIKYEGTMKNSKIAELVSRMEYLYINERLANERYPKELYIYLDSIGSKISSDGSKQLTIVTLYSYATGYSGENKTFNNTITYVDGISQGLIRVEPDIIKTYDKVNAYHKVFSEKN